MTTEFPPSTFPTMSLGAPANLASPSQHGSNTIPSSIMSPEGVQSVLSAVQACSSHNASIRRPAEEQLQQWEKSSSEGILVGYLSNLITIMQHENKDDNMRLLTAILLKNAIPKVFSVPLIEDSSASLQQLQPNEKEILSQSYKERALVRDQLPLLIFNEVNTTIALHLQLAMSNIALFDFPKLWPNMLDTLMHAASSSPPSMSDNKMGAPSMSNETKEKLYLMSTRGIKTLRLCLQSIRQRKMIVPTSKDKSRRGHPMMMLNMGNLGSIIGKAVNERKEMHERACSIFGQLALGIVKHCQAAVGGENNASSSSAVSYSWWQADSMLAVQYIKCMVELLPMVEIENMTTDPRTAPVRQLLSSLVQICDAVKVYPAPSIPSPLTSIPNIQQEYTIKMDKIYRATIICFISAIRTNPQLASPIVPQILQIVVEPLLVIDSTILQNMPVKRLMDMTGLIRVILMCVMYDEKRKDSLLAGSKNAVLAMLSGKGGGGGGGNEANDGTANNPNNDPGVIDAQQTVTALLAEGTIERLCEALVGKFLRLHPEEIEEWENDPEGRYETDLAEKSLLEADSPRHCGGALLLTLMNRETDLVAKTLLELTQKVYQQLPPEDVNGMLNREACYRSLELCHKAMVGRGERRLNFSDWFAAELLPILQTDLGDDSPVAMRAMQARAVQVVQAYSTSLKTEEFGVAFQTIARLIAANDLVTAFCAARCINHLALLHVKGESESAELVAVREHSVFALGNAFTLANRAESEECLRVTLMCVSALVEANGLYLEPVLQAIAEQLPSLWERAQDSVTIHSSLVSVLQHLIMKLGYSTVENQHVQKVLFPLLDYCTDIHVPNRADNLLEDGLRLWLVVLVSSRLATMGASLSSMLPRLADIIRSGLEPHLSLKVLQFNALLLGRQVLEPHATILRDLLLNLTSCIYLELDTMGDNERSTGPDRGGTTTRNAVAALAFAEGILQLFPDELSLSICAPAISKVISILPDDERVVPAPVLEAAFGSFGRMLWMRPTCLDEIFGGEKQEEKIASIVRQFLAVATSVSVLVMLSVKAQKVTFINQKKSMLSLCSAVCQSRTVARASGHEVLSYTRRLLEAESKSTAVSDIDALVEAACGTTRKVVGDGPMGDSAEKTKEVLKSDPLLTVSLKEALENAEKAVADAFA